MKKLARENLKDAMTQQFNNIYGTDENNLAAWQNLCQVLNIDPIPDELNLCRNVSCTPFSFPFHCANAPFSSTLDCRKGTRQPRRPR
jgi:hypothetical protein